MKISAQRAACFRCRLLLLLVGWLTASAAVPQTVVAFQLLVVCFSGTITREAPREAGFLVLVCGRQLSVGLTS